jgi:hypothetical protein
MKAFIKKNLPFLSILIIAALFIAPLIVADDFMDFGDVDDFSDFGDVDDFVDFGDVDDFADFGDVDDFADFGDVDDFSDSGDADLGSPSSGGELNQMLDDDESGNLYEDSPFDTWDEEPPFADDDVPPLQGPFEAIMDVSITDNPDPVNPGDELVYTITYYNRGWDVATDFVVMLDADKDASISDSTPSATTGDHTWNIGVVKAREGGTITVTAEVDEDAEVGETLAAKMRIKYYDQVYGYKQAEETEYTRIGSGTSSSDDDDSEIGIRILSTRFPLQTLSGEPLPLRIRIENSGTESLDDVKIAVVNQELGIRSSVGPFDLGKNDDETKTIYLDIPEWTPEGEYFLRFTVTSNGNIRKVLHRDIEIVSTLE